MVATVGSISIDLVTNAAQFASGFAKSASTVEQQSSRMAKAASSADKAMAGLVRTAKGLAVGAGLGLGAQEVLRYADAWTTANNALKAAEQVSGRQARSLEAINDIARKTRGGLEETANLYSRLLRSTAGVAKSEEEVARATELVNKAFKAGGAAASEQAAGILQLGQALGSGVLQGDELRSLKENAPLLAKAIADSLGVTVGALKELGAAGELTSAKVFQVILKGSADIEKAFAVTAPTVSEGLVQIGNALIEMFGTISNGTGAGNTLAKFMTDIADSIRLTTKEIDDFNNNGGLDRLLKIFGLKLEEGGVADQIRDKVNDMTKALSGSSEDIVASQKRIQEQINRTEEDIAELEAKAEAAKALPNIAIEFTEAAEKLKSDLKTLQDELAAVGRSAEAAANNGSNALQNMTNNAIRAFDAAVAASTAAEQRQTALDNITVHKPTGKIDLTTSAENHPYVRTATGYPATAKRYSLQPDGTFKAYAKGGIANEASIFGEAGPEAAVPLPDGRSIPVSLAGSGTFSAIEENTAEMADALERLIQLEITSSSDTLNLLKEMQRARQVSLGSGSSGGSYGGSSRIYDDGDNSLDSLHASGARSHPFGSAVKSLGGFMPRRVVNGGTDTSSLDNGYETGGGDGFLDTRSSVGSDSILDTRSSVGGGNDLRWYKPKEIWGMSQAEYSNTFGSLKNYDDYQENGEFGPSSGFSTGGIINGDSQQIEFLKGPDEKVIIARPDQLADMRHERGGDSGQSIALGDFHFHVAGNMDERSMTAVGDQISRAVRGALDRTNGR